MADERTWYLGPTGDLRGLVSPDNGVERTVDRYGGVHQSLSGARTMDITGHRATYKLEIPAVTPDESRFLEALHYRTVPGPYRLIDPMSRNRLSRDAAILKPFTRDVTTTSGSLLRSAVGGPTAQAGVPVSGSVWSSYTLGASLTLPPVPVLAGETLAISLWLATASGDTPVTLTLNAAVTNATGAAIETGQMTVTAADHWDRSASTLPMPDQAAQMQLSLTPTSGTSDLWIAAAQIEAATTPGVWDLGGGAPMVLLDQLERSSTIYPLNDLTVTLLEV